jgi:hypothetical protein
MASGKRTLGIVLAVCLGGVALCVCVYGMMFGFESELEPGDRDRVVTIEDLGFEPDPDREVLLRTRYLDGTVAIDYEYDLSDEGIYVSSVVDREHTTRGAREVYVGQVAAGALLIEAFSDDVEVVDSPHALGWGDQSESDLLLFDGEELGYKIDARKGKYVFNVIIMGAEYEPEELRQILHAAFERSIALD